LTLDLAPSGKRLLNPPVTHALSLLTRCVALKRFAIL
jgi:hypothetical protein